MSSSMRGATMSTTFIVDGRAYRLKDLWDAGILEPRERLVTEGVPPLDHTVTIYEAAFLDRQRSLQISEQTYEVMIGSRESDGRAPNELSEEELLNVQMAATPETADAKETYWHGVDTFPPHTDPISIYDLEPQD